MWSQTFTEEFQRRECKPTKQLYRKGLTLDWNFGQTQDFSGCSQVIKSPTLTLNSETRRFDSRYRSFAPSKRQMQNGPNRAWMRIWKEISLGRTAAVLGEACLHPQGRRNWGSIFLVHAGTGERNCYASESSSLFPAAGVKREVQTAGPRMRAAMDTRQQMLRGKSAPPPTWTTAVWVEGADGEPV